MLRTWPSGQGLDASVACSLPSLRRSSTVRAIALALDRKFAAPKIRADLLNRSKNLGPTLLARSAGILVHLVHFAFEKLIETNFIDDAPHARVMKSSCVGNGGLGDSDGASTSKITLKSTPEFFFRLVVLTLIGKISSLFLSDPSMMLYESLCLCPDIHRRQLHQMFYHRDQWESTEMQGLLYASEFLIPDIVIV